MGVVVAQVANPLVVLDRTRFPKLHLFQARHAPQRPQGCPEWCSTVDCIDGGRQEIQTHTPGTRLPANSPDRCSPRGCQGPIACPLPVAHAVGCSRLNPKSRSLRRLRFGRKPRPTICRYKDRLMAGRVSIDAGGVWEVEPLGGDGYVNQCPDGSIPKLVDQLWPAPAVGVSPNITSVWYPGIVEHSSEILSMPYRDGIDHRLMVHPRAFARTAMHRRSKCRGPHWPTQCRIRCTLPCIVNLATLNSLLLRAATLLGPGTATCPIVKLPPADRSAIPQIGGRTPPFRERRHGVAVIPITGPGHCSYGPSPSFGSGMVGLVYNHQITVVVAVPHICPGIAAAHGLGHQYDDAINYHWGISARSPLDVGSCRNPGFFQHTFRLGRQFLAMGQPDSLAPTFQPAC